VTSTKTARPKLAAEALTPADAGIHVVAFDDLPINNIRWIHTDDLRSNSWNPNHVLGPEFKLIKHSLLTNGWIQPVLVSEEVEHASDCAVHNEPASPAGPCDCAPTTYYEIIDGFHRSTMTKIDKDVAAMSGGRVPAAVLKLSVAERMMLTVRINRAKGSHQASLMHTLIKGLVEDHGVPIEEVCAGIGADRHEIERLMMDNVFVKLDIENHAYSQAWRPAVGNGKANTLADVRPDAHPDTNAEAPA